MTGVGTVDDDRDVVEPALLKSKVRAMRRLYRGGVMLNLGEGYSLRGDVRSAIALADPAGIGMTRERGPGLELK